MELLFDELRAEIFSNLNIRNILYYRRINNYYYKYFGSKYFWIIYLKKFDQISYRSLLYDLSTSKHIWLFELLYNNYANKCPEKYIIDESYKYSCLIKNNIMIEYLSKKCENLKDLEIDIYKQELIQSMKYNYEKNFAKDIIIIVEENYNYNISYHYLLANCNSYDIMKKYMLSFQKYIPLHYINIKDFFICLINEIINTNEQTTYTLFINLIENNNINLHELYNEENDRDLLYRCSNRNIADYLVEKNLITFIYEEAKKFIKKSIFPKCEYYIIILIENLIDTYIKYKKEDALDIIWNILYLCINDTNSNIYIRIVEVVCKLNYNKKAIEDIISHAETEGLCYVKNEIKNLVIKFEL